MTARVGSDLQPAHRRHLATKAVDARRLVGLVENPLDLHDEFALVAPGQANPPDTRVDRASTPRERFESFRRRAAPRCAIGSSVVSARARAAAAVLALATIGLLFVGLVAVAGFTVMAQRRLRALGMLGAIGATDRHVRLAMLANGAVVGAVAAVVGCVAGSPDGSRSRLGWRRSPITASTGSICRGGRSALSMVLAVVTAIAAAWWPARAAARIPVVAALSGRPPRPQPAHRFAAGGLVLLAIGLALLAFAHQKRPPLIVSGIVITTVGVLLLAPAAVRALAAAGRRSPIAVRLALRDLARYQSRSGAALGAITLAVGIAATIAVSATATRSSADAAEPNLPANQLIVYLAGDGRGGAIPEYTSAQLRALEARVKELASSLHTTRVAALDAVVNPTNPDVPGRDGRGGKEAAALVKVTPERGGTSLDFVVPLYAATPRCCWRSSASNRARSNQPPTCSRRGPISLVWSSDTASGRPVRHPKMQRIDLPRARPQAPTRSSPLAPSTDSACVRSALDGSSRHRAPSPLARSALPGGWPPLRVSRSRPERPSSPRPSSPPWPLQPECSSRSACWP